ncbi:hypothetical protein HHI36_005776 [Cryptolaemus montrouzieri]|uniref:Uncharacterized protein n=1 Tax=Cryptolaemus montrouzieri TaxID=559131 RepID=A0ABD2NV44_9CUCU
MIWRLRGFACCQKKLLKKFICINGLNVYHESCRERFKNVRAIEGHVVECCVKDETDRNLQKENSTLKSIIQREFEEECRKLAEENPKIMEALKELEEVGSLKDKQMETIKMRMKTLKEESVQNEILMEKR